mmetsp:Transcript_18988/g.41088  ORF Transcript_18988/g.41088 Transcript_18988/m.41088 type:complete len:108 (+) Transcript_18988:910-1233(+)
MPVTDLVDLPGIDPWTDLFSTRSNSKIGSKVGVDHIIPPVDEDLLLSAGPVTPPAAGYDRPTDVIGALTAQRHGVRSIAINTPRRCQFVLEIKPPAVLVALASSRVE